MRISTGQTRRRKVLSLTSLIDVIFLLLLFFMLTSTFARYSNLDVASVGQGVSQNSKPPTVILNIRQATLDLNGKAIAIDELVPALDGYVASGETRTVVMVGEQVSVARLVKILALGRGSAMTSLQLTR